MNEVTRMLQDMGAVIHRVCAHCEGSIYIEDRHAFNSDDGTPHRCLTERPRDCNFCGNSITFGGGKAINPDGSFHRCLARSPRNVAERNLFDLYPGPEAP